MLPEPDALCATFIGGFESPDLDQEYDDPFRKLFEQGALARTFERPELGHAHVERFEKEAAGIDEKFSAAMHQERRLTPGAVSAPAPAAKAADWEEPLTDDSQRLEKRYAGIHKGKKAARVEKSANGLWTLEYDERGELIRGYAVDEAA